MNKIAEGATAEIYNHSRDKVLKLYKPGFESVCKIEFDLMRAIGHFPIAMPKLYNSVVLNGKNGYIMEKIDGDSLMNLLEDGTYTPLETVDKALFLQSQVYSVNYNGCYNFKDIGNLTRSRIEDCSLYTGRIKSELVSRIKNGHRVLCHNDVHFNNIMEDKNSTYLIDWNGAGLNEISMDIGKIVIVLRYAPTGLTLGERSWKSRVKLSELYINRAVEKFKLNLSRLKECMVIRAAEISAILDSIDDINNHPLKKFRDDLKDYVLNWTGGLFTVKKV